MPACLHASLLVVERIDVGVLTTYVGVGLVRLSRSGFRCDILVLYCLPLCFLSLSVTSDLGCFYHGCFWTGAKHCLVGLFAEVSSLCFYCYFDNE